MNTTIDRPAQTFEWPTLLLLVLLYAAFGSLTLAYDALPWWLVLPLGGYLVALHGSLQHEAVHGHPTRSALINELLLLPSLWLWMPYRIYRETHLAHHRDEVLTIPGVDPESYYVSTEEWAASGWPKRLLLTSLNSAAGRLLIGPLRCYWVLAVSEARRFLSGDFRHAGAWLLHLAGCAIALYWVLGICGIPILEYLLLFAYPGLSLTLLRSFLEHQARDEVGERTVIVEAGPIMSLLFLNNNLHVLHHAEPGAPWYRLPQLYRARKEALLEKNGGYFFKGYHQVVWRYLFTPKEPARFPLNG